MKALKLIQQYNVSCKELYNFVLNPINTPKWIEHLEIEESSEYPAKIGTTYRNRAKNSTWDEYVITELKENESFVLTSKDGNYHVRYTIKEISEDTCELEYFEWVDTGELSNPFDQKFMNKLKEIIEK